MRISRLFILLFIATSLLYSCDQVDVTNRYVDVSTNQPDSSDSMPDSAIVFERTVLLEEFTGQKCTNCPDAHRMVAQLINQYGDRLISVAIHSGGFGIAEIFTNDDLFTCPHTFRHKIFHYVKNHTSNFITEWN